MDEIKIHENQTEINDFLEDYENQNIYKCRKCQWQTFKKGDYICTNPVSEHFNQDILRVKGCGDYSNENEKTFKDKDMESLL